MPKPWGYNLEIQRPSRRELAGLFRKLGTQGEVARHLDVSRATIWKWQQQLGLSVQYHPEIPRAKKMKSFLSERVDRVRIAQWICDEGTISTTYDSKNDNTYLLVGGSMTDTYVLREIARLIHERVNNQTKKPRSGWMPLAYVRVHSAEAYAMLGAIRKDLLGLKRLEAESALNYFPQSGYVKGRHSTDEFMRGAWREYSKRVISDWNERSGNRVTEDEEQELVRAWIATRSRKSTYYRMNSVKRKPNQGGLFHVHVDASSRRG